MKRFTIQSVFDIPSPLTTNNVCQLFPIWQYHTTRVYYDNKRYMEAVTKEQVCEAAEHGKIALGGAKVEVIVIS